jgi:hypothetical protein
VRQAAWLNTVPEKHNEPRRQTKGDQFPPLPAGQYLIDLLFEIGPVDFSFESRPAPLCDIKLESWQRNQSVCLSSWDCMMLIKLSKDYASMLVQARSTSCPAPWVSPEVLLDEERSSNISSAMSDWADKVNSLKA